MGSLKLTLILLLVIMAASVVGTLLPQEDANSAIYHSTWFKLVLITLVHNLGICTLRRVRTLRVSSMGFLCVHLGVMSVLGGVLIGNAYGVKGRMIVGVGQTATHFQNRAGEKHRLPFKVKLEDFKVEYYDYGRIIVMAPGVPEPIEVPAVVGKKDVLPDLNCSLEVLRYIPDFYISVHDKSIGTRTFQPRNPAIQVAVTGSEERRMWLFAKYPEMQGLHRDNNPLPFKLVYRWAERVSAYKSRVKVIDDDDSTTEALIEVNHPFSHKGFSLYQLSYDRDHHEYSTIEIVSDPGLWVVYAGFLLIIAGIVFVLYLKPVLRKRAQKGKQD